MKYIADLHVHSFFSRATSSFANLEGYHRWARIKGIGLVGTGDISHPGWLKELKEKLVPEGNGFFTLKVPPKEPPQDLPDIFMQDSEVRFCLTGEISSIYKKNDKTRKVHSVIFAPDLDIASKISVKLASIGNVSSDGRPILGLDPKILLDIIKSISPSAQLVPAHIWTPWFSVFGSMSGFDSIEECFEDLTPEIFALETGLSSDPEMNWRLSSLDRFNLISNSDAHSPQKLGREATVFDTEMSYTGMFDAIRTGKGFCGTFEFYPEEGKYHFDGHRKCAVRLDPEETKKLKGICPVCGKNLTVGVMHRVLELSDRDRGKKPERASGYKYIIPLPEIISEILGKGDTSKAVISLYSKIISAFGNEFGFLLDSSLDDVEQKLGAVFKEALLRMRNGNIKPEPGFDGEFGTIRVFNDEELKSFTGQGSLFAFEAAPVKTKNRSTRNRLEKTEPAKKK